MHRGRCAREGSSACPFRALPSLPQGFKADSPNLGAVWMAAGDWPASQGAPPCAGCKGYSVSDAEGLLFLHVRAFPRVACVGTQSTRKKQRDFSLNSSSSLLLCSSQLLFLCPPAADTCAPHWHVGSESHVPSVSLHCPGASRGGVLCRGGTQ